MLIRRALLLATMVVLLCAAPAAADHTYDHVIPTTFAPPTSVVPTTFAPPQVPEVEVEVEEERGVVAAGAEGDLARTGANNIVPLIQAAIVLLGGGTLLLLVARRRRAVRRAAVA